MEETEAYVIVRKLVRAFPSPPWDADQITLWVEHLIDLDRDQCAEVVLDLINSRVDGYRPTIGAVRQLVAEAWALERGNGWLPWEQAWQQVESRIIPLGHTTPFTTPTRKLGAPSPFVAQVVEHVGWESICMADEDQRAVIRGQFRMAYEAALRRAMTAAAASPGAVPDPPVSRPALPHTTAPRSLPDAHPARLKITDAGKSLFAQLHDDLAGKAVELGKQAPRQREEIPATITDPTEVQRRKDRQAVLRQQADRLTGRDDADAERWPA